MQKYELDLEWIRENAPKTLQLKYLDGVFKHADDQVELRKSYLTHQLLENVEQSSSFEFCIGASVGAKVLNHIHVHRWPVELQSTQKQYSGLLKTSELSHVTIRLPVIGYIFIGNEVEHPQDFKQELVSVIKFLKTMFVESFSMRVEIDHARKTVLVIGKNSKKEVKIVFSAQTTEPTLVFTHIENKNKIFDPQYSTVNPAVVAVTAPATPRPLKTTKTGSKLQKQQRSRVDVPSWDNPNLRSDNSNLINDKPSFFELQDQEAHNIRVGDVIASVQGTSIEDRGVDTGLPATDRTMKTGYPQFDLLAVDVSNVMAHMQPASNAACNASSSQIYCM